MRNSLDAIARLLTDGVCDALTLNWSILTYQHTASIRSVLQENYKPTTANKMLSALRGVLKEALRLNLIDAKAYATAVDFDNIPQKHELRGRALTNEEIKALLSVCLSDPSPAGFRDAALIVLLRGTGIRRAEAVEIKLSDFDPNSGAIHIKGGKGEKDRTVYVPESGIPTIHNWLEIRGKEPGHLICHINRGGRIVLRGLKPPAVGRILEKRASEVALTPAGKLLPFSSHDFRRTFVTELLDNGVDVSTVQKLAGHADVSTTVRYDRRGEETKRKAAQTIAIPFPTKQTVT
jgi:site-specific recombinase XerD